MPTLQTWFRRGRWLGPCGALAVLAGFGSGCQEAPDRVAMRADVQASAVDGDAVADAVADVVADAGVDAVARPLVCAAVLAAGSLSGGFVDLTATVESSLPQVPTAPSVGDGVLSIGMIGDVDGDGASDVLIGSIGDPAGTVGFRYDAATRTLSPLSPLWRSEGRTIRGIIDIDGDGRDEVIGMVLPPEVRWGGTSAYVPLLSSVAPPGSKTLWFDDIDHDGWIDLLVSNDSGSQCGSSPTVRAFLQSAPRRFVERENLIPSRVFVRDGAIISGPLGGRQVIGVVGDQYSCEAPSVFAEGALDAEGYPTFEPFNLLHETLGGPMAAAMGDLDQDGVFDLAISTDPRLMLWRGGAAPLGLVPNTGGAGTILGHLGQPQKPWGIAFLDLDRDTRLDLVVVHGNHRVSASDAPIGPLWTSVYLHGDGDFCLSEVDGSLGLDRDGDWRTLAVGDLDADGDPDLVIGGRGFSSRVYRNDIGGSHRGLALRLRGTTSNVLGIGAHVEVRATAAGRVQHHLVGGSAPPFVIVNPSVFVGLGDAPAAAEVTIRWPSGTVQVLHGLEAGRTHLVIEPPSIVIDPPLRRLRADGVSVARIHITPRDAVGDPAPGAHVAVRIITGGGTLRSPTAVGNEFVVEVMSPRTPGSSVLEVTIDGRPLSVRPRLWWE